MPRHIIFEQIENFRDVGGYNASYGETSFGVLYRSGSLSNATANDLKRIQSLGIKSVIDIRSEESKEKYPDRTKTLSEIHHYEFSVNGNGRVPKDREDMIDSYLEMLEEPYQARKIFLAIAHVEKPAIIHCVAGKDRTGVFIFLTLMANGVPFEEANADYLQSPAYLRKLRAETKKNSPDFPKDILDPNALIWEEVWARFVQQYGSLDEYFDFLNLGDDDVNLLKNCLGKQEQSCGAVVFDEEGKILVERMQHGHFSLPKGHVETFDATPFMTAKREIQEETGFDVTFPSTKSTSIEYSPYPGVAKKVTFYLAKKSGGKEKVQKEEVSDIYWLTPEDALICLTHDSDRYVVQWAVPIYRLLND